MRASFTGYAIVRRCSTKIIGNLKKDYVILSGALMADVGMNVDS